MIYVSGVSGFIGSAIARYLKKLGYDQVGLSRSSQDKLKNELKIEVEYFNLNEPSTMNFRNADVLIHCATANDIVSLDSNKGLQQSVLGTNNILNAAYNAGIKKCIFFSTAQVYGQELNGTINEKSEVVLHNSYSMNHFLGEQVCKHFVDKYGMDICIVRPSNVVGAPRVSTVNRDTLVPICFVNEAFTKKQIILRSSGRQIRNFITLNEIAQAIPILLNTFRSGYTVLNLGSNLNLSILNMAEIVQDRFQEVRSEQIKIVKNNDNPAVGENFTYDSYLCKNKRELTLHNILYEIDILIKSKS
jgi:UDP-glucose 4-epimerase